MILEEKQLYHIFNQGNNKQKVFFTRSNYYYFQQKIKLFVSPFADIIAYCLMPTHYHFLIRENGFDQISAFIQRLFNSYTQAFDRQNERKGKLLDKKPANKLVDSDEYVLQLSRYIHLNPVRAKLVLHPKDLKFSNYLEWIGARANWLLNSKFVKAYFQNPQEYEEFVLSEIEAGGKVNLPKV